MSADVNKTALQEYTTATWVLKFVSKKILRLEFI
jgi:hypothetical protein